MALINKILITLVGLSSLLYSADIKYFLGYAIDESNEYGVNGRFQMEIDGKTLKAVDKFKKNRWMNRLESRTVAGYHKVYYKNTKKIYAEYIKTTPYKYKYGKVYKPKNFKELNIEKILKYNENSQLVQEIEKSNNSVSNTIYGEYIIENNLSIDGKVMNMSKTYYKEFCFDSKKLEEYTSSSCVDRVKLAIAIVISNEHKKIVSYVIFKYKPFRKVLTYDEDGKLREYPTYGQENIKSMIKNYLNLNMTEEWKYIKKIDTLNGRGGVK